MDMAALLFIGLLFFLTSLLCEPVPPPENLHVQALNTNYCLHWSWAGQTDRQTANFSVHYIGKFRLRRNNSKWNTACDETSAMLCDLNPLDLHYLAIYTLRARATVNGLHSQWTHVDFAPAQDAAVGPPPRVQVSAVGAGIEVSISEPQTISNTSMKEKISSLYYRFQYWEFHTDDMSSQRTPVDSPRTVEVLEGLKPWTLYCVSVQSRTSEPNRSSAFTKPVCIRTQGGFQWARFSWIFLTFLCVIFVIGLGVLLGCFYCKRTFQKSVNQPVFISEQVWRFPALLLTSEWQSEQCDRLTVKDPQEHSNSSGRSEWSCSSDSQDSGIYSNSSKERLTAEQERLTVEQERFTAEQERLTSEQERLTAENIQLQVEHLVVKQENARCT